MKKGVNLAENGRLHPLQATTYPAYDEGMSQKNEITIHDLYPDLDEEELRQAEYNLEQYLLVMLRIYRRLELDPDAYARFKALARAENNIQTDC